MQNFNFAASGAHFQDVFTTWTTTAQSGTNWVRKENETAYIYDTDGQDNGIVKPAYYTYESSYGNLIRVEQRASNFSTVLRKT